MANRNFVNWNVDSILPILCRQVLGGDRLESRNGPTLDLAHVGVTLVRPWEREITLPSRKHNLAAQIAETMWVLSGRDDIEFLSQYLPRAFDFSDDGKVWRGAYGKRIRMWRVGLFADQSLDQLEHVADLLRADHNTRRAVIAIYDPEVDCKPGKDIPCNDFLTFSIRDSALDMGVTIRSNDLMWGWSGINAFEWSALQEILAGIVGVKVGALHFSITSLHLYEQHWERAKKITTDKMLGSGELASIRFSPDHQDVEYVDGLFQSWFQIEEMIRTGQATHAGLVDRFPEPMLQSWLRVIQWWWTGEVDYLAPLEGTRLGASAAVSVQPKKREVVCDVVPDHTHSPVPVIGHKEGFVEYVTRLHTEKHAAYGDSWKRRGEMLGIMANIARKIDRLGGGATADETSADTAIDLLVYLAKYRWWLAEEMGAPAPVRDADYLRGDPGTTNALIASLDGSEQYFRNPAYNIALALDRDFNALEEQVKLMDPGRFNLVNQMLPMAYALAHLRWSEEQAQGNGPTHAEIDDLREARGLPRIYS